MRDADEVSSQAMVVYRSPVSYDAPLRSYYYVNPAYLTPNLHLFGAINDQCILGILSFLDGTSLVTAGSSCRALHALSNNDNLWLSLCREEWCVSPEHLAFAGRVEGKALYRFAQQQLQRVAQDILQAQLHVPSLPSHTVQALTRSLFVGPP
ncbi:hypothetical protein H257_01820 [Aphanomyces astaci]|uniref:F-box domain-containing protein n=1 Tax=Aphanomyces astaci TaxID=112090 RepID=W4H549_APHAT|nr:hypothetical protein H257_01820 [Aphanomyces astaci]ETV86721.1 hypothetical protein H257_01820 [Aphanomyces astaci]|eukprot:XP_009823520.1 hypothetical protein H257_01820 [Aphanomyces astaci]